MKNGVIIWNVLLSLIVVFLVFEYFNSRKGNVSASKKINADTLASTNQFRMAYFEMDSVAANFILVKDLKSELTKKEDAINAEMSNRNKAIQQKYTYYQNLDQTGKLTDPQRESAGKELKDMDDEMKNRKQQLDQDYNSFMVTRQNEIKSKIEAYIKEYNKTKNFSYVVSDDPGLFYFQDTAFNITSDVIKGLNEMYKPKKN
jgi:outer membrane protein